MSSARRLLGHRKLACFADGAAWRGDARSLCQLVARSLGDAGASFFARHFATVALMNGRYEAMTQAMRDAHIEPSIIEDLVDFGFDRGFASGIEKGIEQGRIEGMRRALAPLVRLCEKRLGRAMTEPEQARLLAATQGSSDEVADALDKPATELAAWLSQRA